MRWGAYLFSSFVGVFFQANAPLENLGILCDVLSFTESAFQPQVSVLIALTAKLGPHPSNGFK